MNPSVGNNSAGGYQPPDYEVLGTVQELTAGSDLEGIDTFGANEAGPPSHVD